jgi:lysine N6-hydroxylase
MNDARPGPGDDEAPDDGAVHDGAALEDSTRPDEEPGAAADPVYDLVGVGTGPFNLSLAALGDRVPGLRTLFLDEKPGFSWHPGMLIPGTTLQVPFLADLVTLVDPTNPWSYLSYLHEHDRLFPFYFTERFHVPRREYDHYCRWVAASLPSCRGSSHVDALAWDPDRSVFRVYFTDTRSGDGHVVHARHVVLGVGTVPAVPPSLRNLLGDRVFHTADYLARRPALDGLGDVTVIGSGQSGAEALLDLLRTPPAAGAHLRWLTRSPAFAPMEYSKLGLEHFTPDYTRYFHALPEPTRDRLVPSQWQLYKAISQETIGEIYDTLYDRAFDAGTAGPAGGGAGLEGAPVTLMPNVEVLAANRFPGGVELQCRHLELDRPFRLATDAVVLGTGYTSARPALLEPLTDLIDWDDRGRYRIDADYRVALRPDVTGGLFVQNAELHTHGVGAPDLGLGAHRAAVILNAIAGTTVYRLPRRTAFTAFGVPEPAVHATDLDPEYVPPPPVHAGSGPDALEVVRAAAHAR